MMAPRRARESEEDAMTRFGVALVLAAGVGGDERFRGDRSHD